MTITLISSEVYDRLKEIYEQYPALTLQNKGYEYIAKDRLGEEERQAFKEVESILRQHIFGFSEFSNFRLNKHQEVQLRFQYNYNYDTGDRTFIGVGYLLLDELLNGFNEQNKN